MSPIDRAKALSLRDQYRDGLLNDTLPFWIRNGVDWEHGGWLTCLDRDGTLIDTDKSMWQQGRATWLFAMLFNQCEPRDEWRELAANGVRFLDAYGFDAADGRMWFHVTRDGRPLRKRRYAFTESFAAIAYSEYARITGDPLPAQKAVAAFEQFLQRGRALPPADQKFTNTRPIRGIGFPMIALNTAQQLRDSVGWPDADRVIDDAIDSIRRYHCHEDIACVMEQVAPDGSRIDHFDGRTLNPGHAIEGAWFILWEGRYRGDRSLIELGCRMLDWMWQRGWDQEHGGLLSLVDVKGLPVQEYWHDMKFWWPHNEAIIATLLAWLLTGNEKYATWHTEVHSWAHRHFHDPEHGEWFGYLHRDGTLSVPLKGNLWKGPFHLPRMQFVCWQLLDDALANSSSAIDS